MYISKDLNTASELLKLALLGLDFVCCIVTAPKKQLAVRFGTLRMSAPTVLGLPPKNQLAPQIS